MADYRGARATVRLHAHPLFPGDDTAILLADAMERAQAARGAAAAGDTALMAGLRSAIAAMRDWRAGTRRGKQARSPHQAYAGPWAAPPAAEGVR